PLEGGFKPTERKGDAAEPSIQAQGLNTPRTRPHFPLGVMAECVVDPAVYCAHEFSRGSRRARASADEFPLCLLPWRDVGKRELRIPAEGWTTAGIRAQVGADPPAGGIHVGSGDPGLGALPRHCRCSFSDRRRDVELGKASARLRTWLSTASRLCRLPGLEWASGHPQ